MRIINKTNINHGVLALVVQLLLVVPAWYVVGILSGSPWALAFLVSGVAAVCIFIGREYGQVENKVKNRTGRTLSDMYPWHVFAPNLWTLDHYMDIVFPILVTVVPVILTS